ncbi:S16 family serine protease [Curtobacterium sp. MCBD17_035]|uniref:YlbL family protein n=1 Tax=Curtobacterium sp. MCBD17_035 TaxID=2175673 RepID=UPI000DA77D1A|nr:S16 family serine protease [Curtobacterium sp. MCBD17_035]WIB66682.1 S16 family serine protease [Curtobacterium sp. MCBD17_035]
MTLFAPAPARPRSRARTVGWVLVVAAVVLALLATVLPSPYVIELPGPVFNTIGTQQQGTAAKPKRVQLIQVSGHPTYPTAGALDMLTVSVEGTQTERPSWLSVIRALFTKSEAVVPAEAIYPTGETTEQVNKQDAADMADSQQAAVAAALVHQGFTVGSTLTVSAVEPGSAADGVLREGDVIESINGRSLTHDSDASTLRARVTANGAGTAATLVVRRDGATRTVSIAPKASDGAVLLGIGVSQHYDFPFSVKIRLQDVGGPSAGMMFALGTIDKLTPGHLNGGAHVAGTGTIDVDGDVGAIGGIRQKLYGARSAGATVFLAPESNCDEVAGHVPDGLDVYAVSTLRQAVHDLSVVRSGASTAHLARCGS